MIAKRFAAFLFVLAPALFNARAELSLTSVAAGRVRQLTLQGGSAGARLQLMDGVRPLGVVALDDSGRADLKTLSLSSGQHALRAVEWGTGRTIGKPLVITVPAQSANRFSIEPAVATGLQPAVMVPADIDGDGLADLVLAGAGGVVLMHNRGGVFADPVTLAAVAEPAGVAVQDFNGDGRADIAVAGADGRVAILLNGADGGFSAARYFAAGKSPSALVSADFNGDGIPDLAIANQLGNDISILLGNGDGTFQPAFATPVGDSPRALVVADFNGDGTADLAAANFAGNNISILLGDGKGAFRDGGVFPAGNGPLSLAVADFDEDGASDLAVWNQLDGSAGVLMNDGAGAFRPGISLPDVSSFAVGDVNGDGHADLVIHNGVEIRVELGLANGSFTRGYGIPSVTGTAVLALADFNGDGRLDLAGSDASGSLSILSGAENQTPEALAGASSARTASKSNTTASVPRAGRARTFGFTGSSVALSSSGSPSILSRPVTLTATVSPSSASGNVTFYDGSTVLGTKAVAGGQASLTTILLGSGTRSLRAYYSGDLTFAASSSTVLTQSNVVLRSSQFLPTVNYSTSANPRSISVADFNGDSKADLALVTGTGVGILLGNGNGTFQAQLSYPAGTAPEFVSVGDFNGDGKTDLAVANGTSNNVSILLGNGDGTFQAATNFAVGNFPLSLVVADFNGDGKVDVATGNYNDNTISVLLGNGDGTLQTAFTYAQAGNPLSLAVGDFNADGKTDLVVGFLSNNNNVNVLLGNGDGTFQAAASFGAGSSSYSLAVADYNGDGRSDIAVCNYSSNTISILLGNGNGTFQAAIDHVTAQPYSAAAADLNGDGKIDLTVTNILNGFITVLLGNGDGTFQNSSTYTVGAQPAFIAAADLSGDGETDVAVANFGSSTVSILLGTNPLRFVPVSPCRVADTRDPSGPFGGPAIAGQSTRNFTIPNSACSIPANAEAYSFNVAAVPQGPLGFMTLWPAGLPRPFVANLNSDGRIKSGAAIVPAGNGGAISVFATDPTDLVLDINGYFVPAVNSTALAFYPLAPCRVSDTRNANGPLGGPFITGQTSRTIPVQSSSCGVPPSAQAYSVNLAAVPRGPLGFLTAWPSGQTRPFVATLNASTGAITSNAAIVPAGSSGAFDVYATSNTDLVVDINGYFAPATTGGLSLYSSQPCRVFDSRNPPGTPPFNGSIDVSVAGSGCGVPASSQGYVFNATAVPPGPLGFLTLWPQGTVKPFVASLNASDGAITGNLAIVPTTNGSISAFGSQATHLVLDLFGYFAP